MNDFDCCLTAAGHDGRTIAVGDLVRHFNGGVMVWRVRAIYDADNGQPGLSLVDPDLPNHGTSFYADRAVLAD